MQRRWKVTLAGAGTAVAAAGLSVLLVLLLAAGRAAARGPGHVYGLCREFCDPVTQGAK